MTKDFMVLHQITEKDYHISENINYQNKNNEIEKWQNQVNTISVKLKNIKEKCNPLKQN